MALKLATDVITLKTKHPFVIARGGNDDTRVVWVRLTDRDGVEGWGEADPSRYYGETADTVLAALQLLKTRFDLEAADGMFAQASREKRVPRASLAAAAPAGEGHGLSSPG